jgi:hypothetical protein
MTSAIKVQQPPLHASACGTRANKFFHFRSNQHPIWQVFNLIPKILIILIQ